MSKFKDRIEAMRLLPTENLAAAWLDICIELEDRIEQLENPMRNVQQLQSLPVIAPIATKLASTSDAEDDRLYDQWNKKERHE